MYVYIGKTPQRALYKHDLCLDKYLVNIYYCFGIPYIINTKINHLYFVILSLTQK